MIIKRDIYINFCDGCGRGVGKGKKKYIACFDKGQAEDIAVDKGWIEDGDWYICPRCAKKYCRKDNFGILRFLPYLVTEDELLTREKFSYNSVKIKE